MKLPIEVTKLTTQFEEKIVDETNTYIARMGYNIKFNKAEMVEMLRMYINPPLKFEELEEGMWIWDDKEKRYGKVTQRNMWEHGLLSIPGLCWGAFEEDRFYTREVKE